MPPFVEQLTTTTWTEAPARQSALRQACLDYLGYTDMAAFLGDLQLPIAVVLIHGGNASRWQQSLAEHPELATRHHIVAGQPRGFALVDNVLPASQTAGTPEQLPVISYAYYGVKPLMAATATSDTANAARRHFTYHRRPEDAAAFRAAAAAVGVTTSTRLPAAELAHLPAGGHAAELCNILDDLAGADLIVTQFGSDPVSPDTVALTALVLRALQRAGAPVDVLVPTAPGGAYPVAVDHHGLVRGSHHNKLGEVGQTEASAGPNHLVPGGSNVGIRVYDGAALRAILEPVRQFALANGRYTADGQEFSLDHVDAQLGAAGRCRQLYVATPAEARPAKDITRLAAFVDAERELVARRP